MKPWEYLDDLKIEDDAPEKDNPSGLYCPACREQDVSHCGSPEYCGCMKKMKGYKD
jgi:hypothetical protein